METAYLKDTDMKNLKYRELFRLLLLNEPILQNIESTEGGEYITFSVKLKDLGLSKSQYLKYRKEMLDFGVNYLAELLVRENLSQFTEILTGLDSENFLEIVNKKTHTKFGLHIKNNDISFRFHISLVQRIIAEDFKMKIKDLIKDSTEKEV